MPVDPNFNKLTYQQYVLFPPDVVQPDLVVVLKKNEKILTNAKIDGVPDLVIEILSPRNADFDRDLKMKLYQRAGVPEYWNVDPMGQSVEQYVLINKSCEIRENRSYRIRLTILDSASLETTGLFY